MLLSTSRDLLSMYTYGRRLDFDSCARLAARDPSKLYRLAYASLHMAVPATPTAKWRCDLLLHVCSNAKSRLNISRFLRDPRVLVAECFAFLWGVHTPMIVVDIDGTITRSDVPGLLMTLSPGLEYDNTHLGICALLTRIVSEVRRRRAPRWCYSGAGRRSFFS